MQAAISVTINTLNEEKRLPYTLRSVHSWADEIVVVDMHSDDRTRDIAEQFGAKVYLHERVGYVEPARSFAVEKAAHDWVLMLDADELVPLSLSQRLRVIVQNDEADVVLIPWRNYLLGKPLNYGGWGMGQDYHARFFKRGHFLFMDTIHQLGRIPEKARVLKLPPQPEYALTHFNYVDIAQFVEKTNRYTSIEARAAFQRGERTSPVRALNKAIRKFFHVFVQRKGYREGWRGFYLAALMAFYRFLVQAKLTELQQCGTQEEVEAFYRQEAERLLKEYEGFQK
jgi:glycosyltransferase involved in cell wall biosynthesis